MWRGRLVLQPARTETPRLPALHLYIRILYSPPIGGSQPSVPGALSPTCAHNTLRPPAPRSVYYISTFGSLGSPVVSTGDMGI